MWPFSQSKLEVNFTVACSYIVKCSCVIYTTFWDAYLDPVVPHISCRWHQGDRRLCGAPGVTIGTHWCQRYPSGCTLIPVLGLYVYLIAVLALYSQTCTWVVCSRRILPTDRSSSPKECPKERINSRIRGHVNKYWDKGDNQTSGKNRWDGAVICSQELCGYIYRLTQTRTLRQTH